MPLKTGDYYVQNLEFNVTLCEVAWSMLPGNPKLPPEDPKMPNKGGLPRQIVVAPTGFEPKVFHIEQRDEDGLYRISIDGRITYPLNGTVAAQEHQEFGWTLDLQNEIAPNVYTIATGEKQWYLADDAPDTPVTLKKPQKSDKLNVFMWILSPATASAHTQSGE